MPHFEIDVASAGADRVVITVAGEIDLATAPELSRCLEAQTGSDVLVDLSRVTFLDSSGISALIDSHQALAAAGHTLRTTGEQEHVLRVLDVAGVTAMFHDEPA